MIVDAHNHLVWPTNAPGSVPELLDPGILLNSGVIDRAWILSTGPCFRHPLPDQDEAVLALARQHPAFFIPLAYLDFEQPPDAVDRWHERGFAGLKAIFPPVPYDEASCFPFYEKAEKHRMPIVFHVGGSPYWRPETLTVAASRLASKNMLIGTLDLVAKLFPRLVIICAHLGGKHSYEWALYLARGHPNVYLDLSCSVLCEAVELMKETLEVVGADQILFGSDCRGETPIKLALMWKYYLETRSWCSQETKEKILGRNAERILAESGFDPRRIG